MFSGLLWAGIHIHINFVFNRLARIPRPQAFTWPVLMVFIEPGLKNKNAFDLSPKRT
jgi:hypothetical protein